MTMKGFAPSAVAVVLLVSRAASAQSQYTAQPDSPQWLKDRRYNEGIGIRAVEFRSTPSLYLSTLDPQRREGDLVATPPAVAFKAGINATYRELVGVSSDSTASQSQNDITKQRNVSGAA